MEAAYFGEMPMKSSQLAAADLSAKQFCAVTVGSTGVSLVTSQGAGQIKILTNKPIAGDPCALTDLGETKCIAGAAVTKGGLLMTDSSARLIPYVNNGVNVPVGEARMTVGTAGDVFTALVWPTPAAGGAVEGTISDTITSLAGGGRTGAPVLVNGWNRASITATSGDSVQLPVAAPGMEIVFFNDGAAPARVFANGSDTIDGIAGATGVVLTNAKRATFFCLTAPAWQSDTGVKST